MQILNHLKQWLFAKLFWGVLRHLVTDKQYAKIRYRLEQNQSLNLINPSRFTEKIQWIKLYDRTELRKKSLIAFGYVAMYLTELATSTWCRSMKYAIN
jgi:hypothetical protein